MAEAFRDASAGYSRSQLQVVQAYSFILRWFAGHQMVALRSSGGQQETCLVFEADGTREAPEVYLEFFRKILNGEVDAEARQIAWYREAPGHARGPKPVRAIGWRARWLFRARRAEVV